MSPAHEQRACGESKRWTSPISARKDRGEHSADPVDGLDGLIATVVLAHRMDGAVEPLDLLVVVVDEVTENRQSMVEGVGELERVELGGAARAPHVVAHWEDPVLGHHRVGLGLDPRAEVGELRSEPD